MTTTYKIYSFEDNILLFGFIGTINQESVEQFSTALAPYLDQVSENNSPIDFLVDTRLDEGMNFYARRWFTKLNADKRIRNIAVIGETHLIRMVIAFILKATKRDNIRFFSTIEEGKTWLQNN